jgi:hypothetical protein
MTGDTNGGGYCKPKGSATYGTDSSAK